MARREGLKNPGPLEGRVGSNPTPGTYRIHTRAEGRALALSEFLTQTAPSPSASGILGE